MSALINKMTEWLKVAIRKDVAQRSWRVAVVVGTLLIFINYTDRFLKHALCGFDFIKMGLTYLVPYSVATYASVNAIFKEQQK